MGVGLQMMMHTQARLVMWSWLASWSTGTPLLILRSADGQALRCQREREELVAKAQQQNEEMVASVEWSARTLGWDPDRSKLTAANVISKWFSLLSHRKVTAQRIESERQVLSAWLEENAQ